MKRRNDDLKMVIPQIRIMRDEYFPFPKVSPVSARVMSAPKLAVVSIALCENEDPGPITYGEIAAFINKAMQDDKTGMLIELAIAHIVAAKALDDPYFRCDRYKTRIDEWLSPIWELAQDIYEHNAHLQNQAWPPTRQASKKAVGLGLTNGFRPSRTCSSGKIQRPNDNEVVRQKKMFGGEE